MPPSAPSRPETLAADVRAGSRRALAKAITLVESTRADHQRAAEALLVCEAAGYDVVLVETVGVGQSEFAVASMVDFFLVLMLAGAGDELQGIKKGILELADALAINKADGGNLRPAEQAAAQYRSALHLFRHTSAGWDPLVV